MVILDVIGLVAIAGVNFFFYRLLKNEIKKENLFDCLYIYIQCINIYYILIK